ncbi:replication protein A 32 kDa subunit [Nematolebias whitei]|uniref:replication protein A 32 kDa subunit n=1 Tax=Nematolebias whitei TaxID=451745 RepID=UPI00189B260A|nr:replication protein A 32 kDa subunit [Nematolebias whitei]
MWNQGGNESGMAGGYTQSPGGFASPAASQGGEKKGRARATQIIPCTVSQLMTASQADESFRVGDVEVSQVTIVGIIRSTDKSMTNIQYKIDDMTCAPMDVKQWVDTEDPSVDSTVLPPGAYVKVAGSLRSFQNHRSVVAFSVKPLEDMNEITSHMLEVVQAHMALSKPLSTPGAGGGTSSSATPLSRGQIAVLRGNYSGPNSMVINGLNAHQDQVLNLIRSSSDSQGISIYDLKQRLGVISLPMIKQAVEFLSNEGHIFSTIDEDHFKSTDC